MHNITDGTTDTDKIMIKKTIRFSRWWGRWSKIALPTKLNRSDEYREGMFLLKKANFSGGKVKKIYERVNLVSPQVIDLISQGF
jgi:hypothetical protein